MGSEGTRRLARGDLRLPDVCVLHAACGCLQRGSARLFARPSATYWLVAYVVYPSLMRCLLGLRPETALRACLICSAVRAACARSL